MSIQQAYDAMVRDKAAKQQAINTPQSREWLNLPEMEDVARAKVEGWEIEYRYDVWIPWGGKGWSSMCVYRGRPKQPKTTRKVKLLAWFDGDQLSWLRDGAEPTLGSNRVPGEDKTVWVLE